MSWILFLLWSIVMISISITVGYDIVFHWFKLIRVQVNYNTENLKHWDTLRVWVYIHFYTKLYFNLFPYISQKHFISQHSKLPFHIMKNKLESINMSVKKSDNNTMVFFYLFFHFTYQTPIPPSFPSPTLPTYNGISFVF